MFSLRYFVIAYLFTFVMLVASVQSNASIEIYEFSFENDMDLLNGPFGTLTVSDDIIDHLSFTIDVDNSKLGVGADIHQFGFQLNFGGIVSFDPDPTIIMGQQLSFTNKVVGMGNTSFDFVIDFGAGANPTLDPVTFVLTGSGLDLSDLHNAAATTTNTGKMAQFAAHIQTTSTQAGSEVIGGFYIPTGNPEVPEPTSIIVWGLLGAVGLKYRQR